MKVGPRLTAAASVAPAATSASRPRLTPEKRTRAAAIAGRPGLDWGLAGLNDALGGAHRVADHLLVPTLGGNVDEIGRQLFEDPNLSVSGTQSCASCHDPNASFTDINRGRMHAPAETGMSAAYAERTTQKRYRTTPLKGLWQHPPYFDDGSAADLRAVVNRYNDSNELNLGLTDAQRVDLVEYLKSL